MKKKCSIIVIVTILMFCTFLLLGTSTGCKEEEKEIVSQVVVDKEYQEGYTYLAPSTIIINGSPIMITTPHHVPEHYYVKVFVTYIDETTTTKTISVDAEVYNRTIIGEEWKG